MVTFNDNDHDPDDNDQRQTLPIEAAKAAYDVHGASNEVLQALEAVEADVDVDDVQWLMTLCAAEATSSGLRVQCLRVLSRWTESLVARKPGAGEPVPLRFDMVENAVTLLLDESVQDRSIQERVQFLLDKGVTAAEIRYACAQCSLEFPDEMDVDASGLDSDGDRREMIDTGANFLLNDSVKDMSLEDKLVFLIRKGLSEAEIRKACMKAKVTAPASLPTVQVREAYVREGARFLEKPAAEKMKAEEKVDFLQSKDLSNEEIELAFKRIGLPSPGLSVYSSRAKSATEKSGRASDVAVDVDLDLDAEKVKNAVVFLTNPDVQSQSEKVKVQFLEKKGLNRREITAAFDQTGSGSPFATDEKEDTTRAEMVAKAVTFFKHPRARTMQAAERLRYLRSKGVTEEEIEAAKQQIQNGKGADGKIASGVAFFKHPSVQSKSTREKIVFLKQKGFTKQEIEEAASQAGVRLTPSAGLFVNETSGKAPAEEAEEAEETKVDTKADSTPDKPSTSERVSRFLGDKTSAAQPLEDRVRYLQAQGVSEDDIMAGASQFGMKSAVRLALDSLAKEADLSEEELASKRRVQQGTLFLQNKQTKLKSIKDRVRFLEKQGLDEQEILRAFIRAGVEIPPDYAHVDPSLREDKVEMAARFLQNESIKRRSDAQKIEYLQGQDISLAEIDAGAARLGIQLSKESMDAQVEQALNFLLDDRVKGQATKEKIEFLKNQGIPSEKIKQAFKQAGLSMTASADEAVVLQAVRWLIKEAFQRANLDPPRVTTTGTPPISSASPEQRSPTTMSPSVQRAVEFLGKTQDVGVEERIAYLRSKDVAEADIREALRRANVRHPESEARQALVNQAVAFLMDDRTKGQPLRDRFEFLLNKGLNTEEILRAATKTGTDFKGIPALLMDVSELEAFRHAPDAKLSVNGVLLVKLMNASCDLLLTRRHPNPVVLGAKGLLAITLCRLTIVDPPIESFVFGLKVLQQATGDACESDGDGKTNEARQNCLEYLAEFAARTVQIYTLIGDESNTYVNIGETLKVVLATFPSTPDYAAGITLARAFHGKYSMIAATLDYASTAQPAVRFLVVALEASSEAQQPTVAYLTSGMLRGASDYAWGKDLPESPQPRLQKAMRRAAKHVNRAFEASQGQHVLGSKEQVDPMEAVVAVGLACIYADSHIEWNQEVWKAAVEGLLSGALRCPTAFEKPEVPLAQRAASAKAFLSSELFSLAAPILTKVVAELPKPNPVLYMKGQGKTGNRAGVAWIVGRLHQYARGMYLLCRKDSGLANDLARRVVSYTYGEQEDDVAAPSEEDINGGDASGIKETPVQLEEDVDEDEGSDDEDNDGHEEDGEDMVDQFKEKQAPVEPEEDPLDAYLGELAPLARILHMCYLSVVLIGGNVAPSLRIEEALALWDSMGFLAAFQVRVPETVELEDWLVALVQLEDTGREKSCVVAGYVIGLLSEHTNDVGELKEEENVEDWIVGTRLEHLLRTAENQLLPALKSLANTPVDQLKTELMDIQLQRKLDAYAPLNKLGDGVARCKELVKAKGISKRFYATRFRSILVDIGVKHRLQALNIRAHQWMSATVTTEKLVDEKLLVEIDLDLEGDEVEELPYKFAIVPSYVDACIISFPSATAEQLLSFAFGSVLTGCAASGDIQAQSLALVVFEALAKAAQDAAAKAEETNADVDKKRGITFFTLLFTCLKATPLPALEQSLGWVKEIIDNAQETQTQTETDQIHSEGADVGDAAKSYVAPRPFTREWLVTCAHGAIQRTGDTGRRKLLALWFMQYIHDTPVFAAKL